MVEICSSGSLHCGLIGLGNFGVDEEGGKGSLIGLGRLHMFRFGFFLCDPGVWEFF